MKTYLNWSGGKDCCMALKALKATATPPELLLTTANEFTKRVSMHGVSHSLIMQQAACLGLPLNTVYLPEKAGIEAYNERMKNAVEALKLQGFTHAGFGDIFLEDLRAYRDEKLGSAGMSTVYPLWKKDTLQQAREFIASGFKAIVVCVSHEVLDESFCGRLFDEQFLAALPPAVDPCGENGEFHTFVYDGPLFAKPVAFKTGIKEYHTYPAPAPGQKEAGFCHQDLEAI